MNKLDKDYQDLLQDVLSNGFLKKDRTGTGTISVFGRTIKHKMSDGFPLLTTKKMAFKTMATELLWFLKGSTNIKYLIENNCYIWNGDAYKNYVKNCQLLKEPNYSMLVDDPNKNCVRPLTQKEFVEAIKNDNSFSKKWGDLGRIYGAQWRTWRNILNDEMEPDYENKIEYIDQISNLIVDLKNNPDSRRLMVSAWNPSDLNNCILPPCHYNFQCYTRELSINERLDIVSKNPLFDALSDFGIGGKTNDKECHKFFDSYNIPRRAISLIYNCRSQDLALGTPYNISSYSLLLIIIAKKVNMIPEEIISNMGDCHIYLNQLEGVKEQLKREPYKLPTLKLTDKIVNDISEYTLEDILLENYQSHPKIFFPLSN